MTKPVIFAVGDERRVLRAVAGGCSVEVIGAGRLRRALSVWPGVESYSRGEV